MGNTFISINGEGNRVIFSNDLNDLRGMTFSHALDKYSIYTDFLNNVLAIYNGEHVIKFSIDVLFDEVKKENENN